MVLFGLIAIGLILFLYFKNLYIRRRLKRSAVPEEYRELLQTHVRYYQQLSDTDKLRFQQMVQRFLKRTHIEGVGTLVEPLDRTLVAASAIIPIFGFKDWEYFNLTNVILYPDTFNETYQFEGNQRNILGMVGSGALHGQMILSRNALREGFANVTDKSNTAIHEFVHLLDKTDGVIDGMPTKLMEHSYSIPWMQLVHKTIQQMYEGHTDINPYGATSQAEFFAVISEYFFERPDLLAENHPELYEMLTKIFRQKPI
ncbi:zinc-dependent peptidase [Chitinophaga nivalis]|uniref:Zinc-dependent peptidase n=1 Tax=Chitinophaga nivalis TaxID=2991709 RepID=A0ABT3INW3_9BACT|nr:M90 family metallopeptidase [Chitinophaga nivalis]MCW3464636.1 zinc-dependent peptidase [Chitinophaga nivalis]MCW3485673.1 zinc-dependent peptidase [Chitinophaga nivalis]